MVHHITAATSVDVGSGTALSATGPDTFIVDRGAYLFCEFGTGAQLFEAWTVTINGEVGGFVGNGLVLAGSSTSTVTIGTTGDVFGQIGIQIAEAATITNRGTIFGDTYGVYSSAAVTIVNSGTINSGTINGAIAVLLSDGVDTFTDFKKISHVIKNGKIGLIDLQGGDDHFNGGANSETVRDGGGSDVYKLGGGKDT